MEYYEISPGSSTSTIPGPGALTGKAIKALGTATLRGLGRVTMARHLAAVMRAFPHTDEEASRLQDIDNIYDDLLEFSRPDMYNEAICGRTLAFILKQIDMG
ncbi:hypothetical protein H0H81_006266 [Sphagnurus paluster]|uniref:Uncharacterized protein n=1 Tax=Sphagnurus paluster TaxID=117069 RepID=A0A9P7FR16_9AGAR|nr:hypothetical protein H0H81_006266 [Sphagnurus paluster]